MDENLQNQNDELTTLLNESRIKFEEISAGDERVKPLVKEVETYHEQIEGLMKSANAATNEIAVIAGTVEQTKVEITALHTTATTETDAIETLKKDAIKNIDAIEDYMPQFEELKAGIENEDEGLAATLKDARATLKEVEKTKEGALAEKIKSENFSNESKTYKEEIAALKIQCEGYKTDIGKILDLVRDTGLSNAYDKRRKRSERTSLYWAIGMLAGVALAVIMVFQVYLNANNQAIFDHINNDFFKFLFRLTLTSPAVFLIWFSAAQFSKERFIQEQYEHKTATALSIENYTKLLNDNYNDKDFIATHYKIVCGLIQSIHKEPVYPRKNAGINFKGKFPFSKAEGEINAYKSEH